MKKSVKIILLIVVVAILGGALYFLNADTKENKNMVVLQLPEETVTEISFKTAYSKREAILIKDKESGAWKCEDVFIKDVFITDIFNSISTLRAESEIPGPVELSQYGLDNPKVVVKIKTANGDYEILIGDYNAVEKAYYFKISGSDSVFVTEEGSKLNYAFDYDTDAFINGQK